MTARQPAWLIEVLTVAVLVVVPGIMSARPLSSAHQWNSRQSAIDATNGYLFRARAFASRASRSSWLVREGNVIKVLVDSAGIPVPVAPPLDVGARYGVVLSMPSDTVAFDPRGFARDGAALFVIGNSRGADTVCVNAQNVVANGCR